MKLNKLEGKIILIFQIIILHLVALGSKLYLYKNKELKKDFSLLEDMRGIMPLIYPNVKNGSKLKFGYLVKGTSIILHPPDESNPPGRKKYAIVIGLTESPWEKFVNLEYVFDNYPDKVKQNFLFNLTKFN